MIIVQFSDDMVKEELEEEEELLAHINEILAVCFEDYSHTADDSPEGQYAAEMAKQYITEKTREGHIR